MPKLGVTSTTSSDHQNHNHLALPSHQLQQQGSDNPELDAAAARFQQHRLPAPIRHPINWQDQINLNANIGNPRWLYSNPYTHASFQPAAYPTPSANLPASTVNNNLNSGNIMIGQDGDDQGGSASTRPKNLIPTNQLPQANVGIQNLDTKVLALSGLQRQQQNYQWLDGIKGSLQPLPETTKAQSQRISDEMDKNSERFALYTYNLLSTCIPGTNKPKRVVPLDSIEDLRASIYCGEFYSKFEDVAIGILANQVIVPEFSILDYIRRDKFSRHEIERIENVHKRLGILNFSCLMDSSQQRPYMPNLKGNDNNKPASYAESSTHLNPVTGTFQQPPNHQAQSTKGDPPFLSPSTGKYESNFPPYDKGCRLSQSPSDIISRSQSINVPAPRVLSAHSSTHQSLSNTSITNAHLAPSAQRTQQLTYAKSPFQPNAGLNPYPGFRPPKSNSTIGLGPPNDSSASVPSHLTPMSTQIRQPPAAHQSSSARSSILGPSPNLAIAHSTGPMPSGPPVTAHMSSKTPQTPKLQHAHESGQSTVNKQLNNEGPHQDKLIKPNLGPMSTNQPNFTLYNTDLAPGLPNTNLLGIKQHDQVNREGSIRSRSGTPRGTGNNTSNQSNFTSLQNQHGSDISRSPLGIDPHLNSKSPLNQQSLYGSHPSNLNNSMAYKPTVGPNFAHITAANSMPPPSMDYQKNLTPSEVNRLNETRSSLSPSGNTHSFNSESHLKQYSALMNAYQQQQHALIMTKCNPTLASSPSASTQNLGYSSSTNSPSGSLHASNQSILLDLQNHQPQISNFQDARQNLTNQQPSPKQNNQRSIITGSASSRSKKSKKAKASPNCVSTTDSKSSESSGNNGTQGASSKLSAGGDLDSGLNQPTCDNKLVNGGNQPASTNNDIDRNHSSNDLLIPRVPVAAHASHSQVDVHQSASNLQPRDAHQTVPTINTSIAFQQNLHIVARSSIPTNASAGKAEQSDLEHAVVKNGHSHSSDVVSVEVSKAQSNESSTDLKEKNSNCAEPAVQVGLEIKPNENFTQPVETPSAIQPQCAETSKYQKLYTKKAWLKNYDQEDQASRTKHCPNEEPVQVKSEAKTEIVPNEAQLKGSKTSSPQPDEMKSSKNSKIEGKRKPIKESPEKKTNSSVRSNRGTKFNDNDSEVTNASTSESDSDATASSKSPNGKKLRRMPSRKVKPGPEKDESRSPQAKSIKDSVRKRPKREMESDDLQNKRKLSVDDDTNTKKARRARSVSKLAAGKAVEDAKASRRSVSKTSTSKANMAKESDVKPSLYELKKSSQRSSKFKDHPDSKSSGSQSDDTLYSSADSEEGSLPSDGPKTIPKSSKKAQGTKVDLKRFHSSGKNRSPKNKSESTKVYPTIDDDEDSNASTQLSKPVKKLKKKSATAKSAVESPCLSPTNDENSSNQVDTTNKQDDRVELYKVHKKTGEKFLQTDSCYDIVPKNIRCLECRKVRHSGFKGDKTPTPKQSKTNWDDFCRFYEFRKLKYNKTSHIVVAGFSDLDDAQESDKTLWLPQTSENPNNLSYSVAKFIIANVGTEFCDLVMQERAAKSLYEAQKDSERQIIWKRAVNGLRELCDVCATSLFNCHYVCERCGFVVCIDCYQSRAKSVITANLACQAKIKTENGCLTEKMLSTSSRSNNDSGDTGQADATEQPNSIVAKKSKRDSHGWIFCAKNEEHSHEKLTLAQIIAGDCLEEVWRLLHETRERLNLGSCNCNYKFNQQSTSDSKSAQEIVANNESEEGDTSTKMDIQLSEERDGNSPQGSHSTLKGLLLASNTSSSLANNPDSDKNGTTNDEQLLKTETMEKFPSGSSNRQLVQFSAPSSPIADSKMFNDSSNEDDSQEDAKLSQQVTAAIEGCISSIPPGNATPDPAAQTVTSEHETAQSLNSVGGTNSCKISRPLSPESDDLDGQQEMHSWLCDGDLLVLSNARHDLNMKLFRRQWRQGKPLIVRGIDKTMKIDMWLPQFFAKEFGDYRSDLVDCRNGDIHRHSMKKFWDGFEQANNKKRIKDDALPLQIPSANNEDCSNGPSYYSGSPLWRLKDWPPGQDFKEILPLHYGDFMNNLPLQQYTTRTGDLNLACRLPKEMVKPDLGPKMYSAYGTSNFPERGTTNLHLDMSDAINVMIYVSGANSFHNGSEEMRDIYDKTVDECAIDLEMKQELISKRFAPGALWHIFKPSDSQKIRDFLNKVADERKISPEKRSDPIHDQTWYLDQPLLDRLKREFDVKPYAILQCMGDAIIIPAGAPHQVKNVQNCIKVANDFVSPENIRFCLQLTNEFRNLPDTHLQQEDKLQIKNILYHSVKESLQCIKLFESGRPDLKERLDEDNEVDHSL